MLTPDLVVPSLVLAIFYSIFLYTIKSWFRSRVRVFFKFLFITMTVLSLFWLLENEKILTSFGLGVMACEFGLSKSNALPYLPETRHGAKYSIKNIQLHHSFWGMVLLGIMILLDVKFSIQEPYAFLFSFLFGGAVFAVTSQIPEISEEGVSFWKKTAFSDALNGICSF